MENGSNKRSPSGKWERCDLVTRPPASLGTLGKDTLLWPLGLLIYEMRDPSEEEDRELCPEEGCQGQMQGAQ